jgi:hypothetical protein
MHVTCGLTRAAPDGRRRNRERPLVSAGRYADKPIQTRLKPLRQWRIMRSDAVRRDASIHGCAPTAFRRRTVSSAADRTDATAEQGPVIRGSGGLRKVRWAKPGGGKRGGLRVIYYWAPGDQAFYMLYGYTKSEQGDFTAAQVRQLGRVVREEFK